MADASKTEKPTARRLREARKDGQFPRTQDPATWLGIAAGAALVPHAVDVLREEVTAMLARLPAVAADPTAERALAAVADLPRAVLLAAAPVGVAAAVAAIAATAAQGVHLTTKTLKFKASRLSPKHGLKRMLGPRALWEAAKALVKVLVIAAVVVVLGRSLVPELMGRGARPLGEAVATLTAGLRSLVWVAAGAGVRLGPGGAAPPPRPPRE